MQAIQRKPYKYMLLSAAAILLCCICSEQMVDAVKTSIELCLTQLIPSMLIFLILANLYPISAAGRQKKRLPAGFFGMLFLTITGGYPVGAIGIRRAYLAKTLSLRQAKALSPILFCCGPGFLIGYLGVCQQLGRQTGLLLFAAQIITLLLGLCVCLLLFRKEDKKIASPVPDVLPEFSIAIIGGVKSMANICATVILFSCFFKLFSPYLAFLPQEIGQIIAGLSEVTSGCAGLCFTGGGHRAAWMLFFCGFGGICVHLQVYGILKECAPRYPVFLGIRLLSAAVSVGIYHILSRLFPAAMPEVSCFSVDKSYMVQSSAVSPYVFVLLIACSLLLVASFFTENAPFDTKPRRF